MDTIKQTVMISVKDLKNYERNPRKIDKEQFAKLCESIKSHPEYFLMRPLLVFKDYDGSLIVYAGNQRLRAAKRNGLKEVPCIVDESINEEELKKRIVLDNISHGEFDYDMLAADFDYCDLIELGLTEKEMGLILNEKEAPEKKKKQCPHCGEDI